MQTYNRIYSEEIWKGVNQLNKNALDDYLEELRANKKRESTIAQYKNDLRIILIYIKENLNNKDITECTRKDFRRFLIWLSEEKGLSNARCNRLMSTLRTFLEYICDDDDYEIEINQASKVKGLPKESIRDIIFLRDEDVIALYNYFIDMKKYREALAVGLLYETGARKNEIMQITRNSLRANSGITNTVIGKRAKKFRLTYFRLTREAFRLLEEQREDDYDCLFINRLGEPMTTDSFYAMVTGFVNYLALVSDVDYTGLNPHSFRHSFIENMRNGTHIIVREVLNNEAISLQKIQLLAHHSDVSTTVNYCKSAADDEIAELFNLNPEDLRA